MKKYLFLLLLLAQACRPENQANHSAIPVNGDAKKDSVVAKPFFRYAPKDNSYSIHFPKQPKEITEKREVADLGELTTHLQAYEDRSTQTAYLLSYTDYPAAALAELIKNRPDAIANLLQDTKNGLLRDMGVAPTAETPMQLQEHAGLDFSANNGSLYLHYRLYFVGIRLYQLCVMRAAALDEQAVSAFFESFQLAGTK